MSDPFANSEEEQSPKSEVVTTYDLERAGDPNINYFEWVGQKLRDLPLEDLPYYAKIRKQRLEEGFTFQTNYKRTTGADFVHLDVPDIQRRVFEAMAKVGTYTYVCMKTGISLAALRAYRQGNPEFDQDLAEQREVMKNTFRERMYDIALNGYEEETTYHGIPTGRKIRKFSGDILARVAGSLMPEEFGPERARMLGSGENELTDDDEVKKLMQSPKARRLIKQLVEELEEEQAPSLQNSEDVEDADYEETE